MTIRITRDQANICLLGIYNMDGRLMIMLPGYIIDFPQQEEVRRSEPCQEFRAPDTKATLTCGCSGDRISFVYSFCLFHTRLMGTLERKEAAKVRRMLMQQIDQLSGGSL